MHAEHNFKCKFCNNAYTYEGTLKTHVMIAHCKTNSYICNQCDYHKPGRDEKNKETSTHSLNGQIPPDKDQLKVLLEEVVTKIVRKEKKKKEEEKERVPGEKLIFDGKALEREVLDHRKALEQSGWRLQEGGGWRIEQQTSGHTWQSVFAQMYSECDPKIKKKLQMGNIIRLGRFTRGLKRRKLKDSDEMLKWGIFPSLACINFHKRGVEGDWAPMTKERWKRVLENCLANKKKGNYNWNIQDLRILRPRVKQPVKAKRELSYASKVKAQINYKRLVKTLVSKNKSDVRNLTANDEMIETCNSIEKLEQRGASMKFQERNHTKEDKYNTLMSVKMVEEITDLEKKPTDLVRELIKAKVKESSSFIKAIEEAQKKHKEHNTMFKNETSEVKIYKSCNICFLAGKKVIFQSQKKKKHIVETHLDSFQLEDLTSKDFCPKFFPVVKIVHPPKVE